MHIEINQLSKVYPNGTQALNNINLDIKSGIIGLLGPNGAGKSTLMSILATLAKPTQGGVIVNGEDILKKPKTMRKLLGYLPQYFGVYDQLTPIEFLQYLSAVKGLPHKMAKNRIEELLCLLNLEQAKNIKLSDFSGGMRQRVGIAQALLNDPKVLIIDEPTVGLDPEERIRFRKLLSGLAHDRIVILSTHIVSDVESIASDIVLIAKGETIIKQTPEVILATLENKVWSCLVTPEEVSEYEDKFVVCNHIRRASGIELRVISTATPDKQAKPVAPTLEDAYLYYTRNNEPSVHQNTAPEDNLTNGEAA